MARPRTLKLPSGSELVLRNGTLEEYTLIKTLFYPETAYSPVSSSPSQDASVPPAPEEAEESLTNENNKQAAEMKNEALGIHLNPDTGHWCVAVLKYDPETKEARVVEEHDEGIHRVFASDRFRIMAGKRNIV